MSNGNLEELNLKKSLDELNKFQKAVENKNRSINVIKAKLIKEANKALINQGKFAKLMEELREYVNPNIFDNDEYKNTFEKKRSDIALNLHDSLKVLIYFYKEVDKTASFPTRELQRARKALNHQFNFMTRMRDIFFEIASEYSCGKRPRTRMNRGDLPDEL